MKVWLSIKYMGAIIDAKLRFRENYARRKAASATVELVIIRTRKHCRILFLVGMVRSIMLYASTVLLSQKAGR